MTFSAAYFSWVWSGKVSKESNIFIICFVLSYYIFLVTISSEHPQNML